MDTTKLFLQANRAGFMAMTYSSLFWGVKARAVLADYFARVNGESKARSEVRELEDIGRQFHKYGHPSYRDIAAAATA
ncbi:hypothetical protein JQ616_17815 [Bradyrhizobium tropiciagri]|uniref:hypothetical protein n=1 Tax=Bradyrhizobium tropiciagri TaxID=312253 RepID=UPI001BA595E4|nr:hypothetical protein [Bradyrhizobium tropiciagri]MBR0896820.1 hypothetical protein [Bradyrhizobium tropiciagri]